MEARIRTVVLGVIREALRESGARGLILATAPGPEARLLAGWCDEGGVALEAPDEELIRTLTGALEAQASPELRARASGEARRAAARLMAGERTLIPVAAINRTALLLSPAPPPEPFLPLGDVPATAVRTLAGECTLPDPFQDLAREAEKLLAAEALLEELGRPGPGRPAEPIPGVSPELRRRLEAAIAAGSWGRRVPPLVPKLGSGTWGLDLDL